MTFSLKDIAARWFVRSLSIDKALISPNTPDLKQALRLKKELRAIRGMDDGALALKLRATQLALEKAEGDKKGRLQTGLKYLHDTLLERYIAREGEKNRQRNQHRETEQQDRLERYKYTRAWRTDI